METKRAIVAAAIKEGGLVFSIKRPARHHDIIREMARCGIPIPITGAQGFLTSDGLFMGRYDAMEIAVAAGQLIPREGQRGPNGELFSEDLW